MSSVLEEFKSNSTILLVDDEPNVLSSLSRLLEEEEYHVVTALSGEQGLKVLDKQSVDLIISDMRMPNMDGATFLKLAAQQWPDTMRILLTGYADLKSTIDAVNQGRIFKYLNKPWDDDEIIRTVNDALEIKHLRDYNRKLEQIRAEQNAKLLELTEQQEATIQRRTAELQQTAMQLDMAYQELQEAYYQTVPLLAHLIELNERYKKQHSTRVAQVSQLICKKMSLSDHESRQIYFAAVLHDIGKIGIESAILGKSLRDMSINEQKRYYQHVFLGEAALMSFDPLKEVASIIRCHHERYDGKGFPGRLSGQGIPMGARIIALADDYDNLQLPNNFIDRVLSEDQAHAYILAESGKRYDPAVVSAFDAAIGEIRALLSQKKEAVLTLDKLVPGMKLSRDLVNHHGLVMLAAGKTIHENHIAKLKLFEATFNIKLQVAVVQEQDPQT